MCLAIPGQVEKIEGRKAEVSFGGLKRTVDCSLIEEVQVGDWVLVHVGFAIQTVDAEAAHETYRLLAEDRKKELEREVAEMEPR